MEDKKLNDSELKEVIKKADNEIEEGLQELEAENIIKDNILTFDFQGTKYRVVKPTFAVRQLLYKELSRKKLSMIMDEGYLPAEILKKKWIEKGIDIEAIEKKIKDLNSDKEKYEESLGKLLSEDNPNDNLEGYKKKIEEINNEINFNSFKISSYLDISLETQLEIHTYAYLAYLISEKEVDNEWVKAFNTYEEFANYKYEKLINKLCLYSTVISRDEIQI